MALAGIVEFAPDDTPRAVEQPGVAALPLAQAVRLLTTVYGFAPELPDVPTDRLEFSIHPNRVGYRRSHTLWWELEPRATTDRLTARPDWPNRFSRHLGDKAYGLLMADLVGLPVPRTTVIARRVAPFSFGRPTSPATPGCEPARPSRPPAGTARWPDGPIRTHCWPRRTRTGRRSPRCWPSRASTRPGPAPPWPARTAPTSSRACPAGATASCSASRPRTSLPAEVLADVRALADNARQQLGPVRLEWVHDGSQAWVVQLHIARQFFAGASIVSAGEANRWLDF